MAVSAIPALQPIVHDLFLLRGANKSDISKELETQREVLVSMLLRLINYYQVLLYHKNATWIPVKTHVQVSCSN